tara:strand:- start:92 stop:298 length:207 start_codon:yes stop_codon:yes gene_type:complete
MKPIYILFVILAVSIIGSIAVEVMSYLFGADNVFFIALGSIPFLLVWCIATDKSINKKSGETLGYKEI